MADVNKVIKGLEWILEDDKFGFGENWHIDSEPKTEEEQAGYNIQRAIAMLKELPDIVRCKDCHYGIRNSKEDIFCIKAIYNDKYKRPNWFCADGERGE